VWSCPPLDAFVQTRRIWARAHCHCVSAPAAPDQTRHVCSRGGPLSSSASTRGGQAALLPPIRRDFHLVYGCRLVAAQHSPAPPVVTPPPSPGPPPAAPPVPTPTPVPPPEPQRPVTRTAAGVIPLVSYRNLSATTSSTPSSISTNYRSALVNANWRAANPVHHRRTKHIEIDIHFVREKVALGEVRVLHVPSPRPATCLSRSTCDCGRVLDI
jgi:hypothetical protein